MFELKCQTPFADLCGNRFTLPRVPVGIPRPNPRTTNFLYAYGIFADEQG
jgi:hypothetical protein